jgi:hypothetical protein
MSLVDKFSSDDSHGDSFGCEPPSALFDEVIADKVESSGPNARPF